MAIRRVLHVVENLNDCQGPARLLPSAGVCPRCPGETSLSQAVEPACIMRSGCALSSVYSKGGCTAPYTANLPAVSRLVGWQV